jgi:hypothetical protein
MTEAGEILKSGAGEKIADLINKLAGPLAEEVGMMLGDTVRVYRVINWVATTQKTERLLREAGLPANAVPPRLFLRIMDASSIEDNETLQDMWAGLLATTSQKTDAVSPSFVETLKQLTPGEARYMQQMYEITLRRPQKINSWERQKWSLQWNAPENIWFDTYERLGLVRREYELTDAGTEPTLERVALRELDYDYLLTDYAVHFIQACQGPKAASPSPDAAPADRTTA